MELQWFKLSANFDKDDRITVIEGFRNGSIAVHFYIKLYCIAARCNLHGGIYISPQIPHTAKTLAKLWHCKEISVKNTLQLLILAGMLEEVDGVYYIADWYLTQCTEKLEEIREKARLRKQKSRAKQAELSAAVSRDGHGKITPCHTTEEEKEKEIEIEIEIEAEADICQRVCDAFNATTKGEVVKYISTVQRQAIKKLLEVFDLDQIKECFTLAAESDFLNGNNESNWVATFDWLLNPNNMAKVLNGNYKALFGRSSSDSTEHSFESDEFITAALARGFTDF